MVRNNSPSPDQGADTRTAEEISAAAAREAAEKEAAEKAEADRLAAEKADADRVAAEKAEAEKADQKKAAAAKAAAHKAAAETADAPALVVFAKRAMFRAGRAWSEGRNELTRAQVADLGDDKLAQIHADPNFSMASPGKAGVAVADGAGQPVDAHLVVMAKRAMFRAARAWSEGANPLTQEQAAELGEKLDLVRADPNFTVIQPKAN
ncbi:MAG: hypothetical protein K2Y40_12745 [Reyranella sp.]|nr:hypothetical protein [Reyranella sp.]